MGGVPRGDSASAPPRPQGTEGKEEGRKGPEGLGLEDRNAREAAMAGAFGEQEWGWGRGG